MIKINHYGLKVPWFYIINKSKCNTSLLNLQTSRLNASKLQDVFFAASSNKPENDTQ